MPSTRHNRLLIAVGVCVLAAGAAACAHSRAGADVPAAKGSGDGHCRRITADAPGSLAGFPRRGSGAAGVAVWGDQNVVLRCGVTPPGPTKNPCFSVNGIDWVIDERQTTNARTVIVTYGRTPATQVIFGTRGKTDVALVSLSRLVAPIRQTSHCTDAQ